MLPASPQSEAALRVLRVLRAEGFVALLAGGCVRDLLLNRVPIDYDIATSATPDIVLDLFPRTFAVGAHFGVVLVAQDIAGTEVVTEVATFRSDGAYSDGRRPDAVHYTVDPREDVLRRDFTINGLLLDPEQSTSLEAAVLDFVDGLSDLHTGVIRAIGDADLRFCEDHLRMLRAIRFAARYNFSIEHSTLEAIRRLSPCILSVSRERARDELSRMLTEGGARSAFELLEATTLLEQLLPEVARMRGVAQPAKFHPEGDVWSHTLLLLEQLPACVSPTLAWGALLHDVGKPPTFTPPDIPGDRIRFHGHAQVGARMAQTIAARLRFSRDDSEQVTSLVEQHMRFGDAARMKLSTLKRFVRQPQFAELLALHRMDALAASGNLESWQFISERLQTLSHEELKPPPLITGDDLVALGYLPGPRFRQILDSVEEAQLDGSITTREEALSLIAGRFPLQCEQQS